MSAAHSAAVPAARLVKDLTRRYRLTSASKLLDIGGDGHFVDGLRTRGVTAFGLFDGAAPPRDPYANQPALIEMPQRQPAVLHQGIPFPAQSFECVLLRQTKTYDGSLASPEACTATANLLASLKPGGVLLWCVPVSRDELVSHLSAFPGQPQSVKLGTGGIAGALLRTIGIGRNSGLPAVEYRLPKEPISRLEWHRIARQAVMSAQQPAA
ncbi:MAG: hypothetical protein KDA93_21980 [Planctomycetaceae bacterium]|nr:hypothetical protein [Planctomycetaceae bacterium]